MNVGADRRRFNYKPNNTVEEETSPKPEAPRLTFVDQSRLLLFNSWFHLLLLFIPAGFAVYYCHLNSILVFVINFMAIIPSAMDLALAVDDLSLRTGEKVEGLISMTFRYGTSVIRCLSLFSNAAQQRRPANYCGILTTKSAGQCIKDRTDWCYSQQPSPNDRSRLPDWRLSKTPAIFQHLQYSPSWISTSPRLH